MSPTHETFVQLTRYSGKVMTVQVGSKRHKGKGFRRLPIWMPSNVNTCIHSNRAAVIFSPFKFHHSRMNGGDTSQVVLKSDKYIRMRVHTHAPQHPCIRDCRSLRLTAVGLPKWRYA